MDRQLRHCMIEIWNEMCAEETDEPPSEVILWCEKHINRLTVFLVKARRCRERDLCDLCQRILQTMKSVHLHYTKQLHLVERHDEVKSARKLAALMARDNEVRSPLRFFQAELMAEIELAP